MIDIFLTVVLPVFVVAAIGAVLHRIWAVPSGPLSQVSLYALSPALTFAALYRSQTSFGASAQIFLFAGVHALANLALAWAITKAARMDRQAASAFLLSTVFGNAGNYGLSISLLAFGEEGLEKSLIYFVAQAVLSGTLAVYLAARSTGAGVAAIGATVRQPLLYAAIVPMAFQATGIPVPAPVFRILSLLGDASIPLMLLVLGIELSRGWSVEQAPALGIAVVMRLVVSTLLGAGIATLLGMDELTRSVMIIQSAMPTAIYTIILATEFGARPRFVTSAVATSTLLSLGTVTLVVFAITR
jgi:predicted permease